MKTRKSFLLRLDPKLHAALEEWSEQEMRSLNGQIEYLLREAVLKRNRHLKLDQPTPGAAEPPDEKHAG